MGAERREFKRVSLEIKANYRVFLQKTLRKEELFYGTATIVNLSGGGIQVKLGDGAPDLLENLLENHRKLLLEFDLDVDGSSVKIQGKMIWVQREEKTQAGVCFVDIDSSKRKLILDYVEQCIAKDAEAGS